MFIAAKIRTISHLAANIRSGIYGKRSEEMFSAIL